MQRAESRALALATTGTDALSVFGSTRSSAADVHELVYGGAEPEAAERVVERLYEPNAVCVPDARIRSTLTLVHAVAVAVAGNRYENPLITASSRAVIGDIHQLARQLAEVDVPRPLAMFATLFGADAGPEPWFQASRVWSELGDICETESFDGHRVSIIEHTVHVVLLPQLHAMAQPGSPAPATDLVTTVATTTTTTTTTGRGGARGPPRLSLAGGRVLVPSPLHFSLRVSTRLSFNEAGRITWHRDSWDVGDVVALAPGMRAVQALTTRAAAFALSAAARWLGHGHGTTGGGAASHMHLVRLKGRRGDDDDGDAGSDDAGSHVRR